MKKFNLTLTFISFLVFFSTLESVAQPGSLVSTFGVSGLKTIDLSGAYDRSVAMALDKNGKIILAGFSNNGTNYDISVARLNSDGSLDNTFNVDGKKIFAIGTGDDYGVCVSLDANGKIVIGGISYNGSTYDYILVRLNVDGSFDTSFDSDGIKVISSTIGTDVWLSMLIDTNGKILLSGYLSNGTDKDFYVMRLLSDGSFDNTFDSDGKLSISVGSSNDACRSIAVGLDGKIYLAGDATEGSYIVKINDDGSLNNAFGASGKLQFSSSKEKTNSILVDGNGKLLVTGKCFSSAYGFGVSRLNTDGSFDTSFDTDGKLEFTLNAGDNNVGTYDGMTLDSNGKILLTDYYSFSVVRLNTDGSFDNTFGTDGKSVLDFGNGFSVKANNNYIYVAGGKNDFKVAALYATQSTLSKNISTDDVNVYPNPSNGDFAINLPLSFIGSITLTDNNGKVVDTRKLHHGGVLDFKTSGIASGCYILQINGSINKSVQVIVK
jgi:uncharacterized delta-60 repeat protein